MKTKKRDSEANEYVSKETYLLLEEKYNQSVESYNVLLYQLKQLQRAQFGTKLERFTDLFDGQQALFESKALQTTIISPHEKRWFRLRSQKGNVRVGVKSPHILTKAVASEELLAHIVITKLIDRQPLYHMEKYWLERFKVNIRRQTLARWMIESATKLMPLVNLLKEEIMSYHLITIDATKIQVLKEAGRKATTASSMYCIRGGPPDKRRILLEYNAQKHKQFVDDVYAECRGLIQSDAEVIFVKLGDKEGITVSLCNAHARRKFEPIAKASKTNGTAYQAMRYFRRLYKIEAKAKSRGAKACVLPQSALGKAIAYRLNHWEGLTRFLDHGELEIDNNATEREIKVLVMARKNVLFSYSVEGAAALGIYFSIIQSARAHNLEPESYLTAIFKAIPLCKTYEDYAALLPWNYAKTLSENESKIDVA